MFQLDWQHNTIADGVFTVEADRARVARLGEAAAEGKLRCPASSRKPSSHSYVGDISYSNYIIFYCNYNCSIVYYIIV